MARNYYWASVLTGGAQFALDAIDATDTDGSGTVLADGDIAEVVTDDNLEYKYRLNATSGATEDSPDIIEPDFNGGLMRWIRVKPYGVVNSSPESGEFRISDMRLESDKDVKIVYDDVAES